ncbi:17081_t:CDS:2 [Funneliformis caledonium]|uniref:17081_t:CDS:1 n=1 Tax=Funneliformis caledonium TaxID=1117310 RepID=A0A9N9CRP5_9GLOM|nr:17081_t:CDS:2 [Funneliformis caledonium]
MTDYEIQSSIRNLLKQYFLKKLKGINSIITNVDDKVNKYWISAKAEEDVKPLDWWKTYSTEYPNLSKLDLNIYVFKQVRFHVNNFFNGWSYFM